MTAAPPPREIKRCPACGRIGRVLDARCPYCLHYLGTVPAIPLAEGEQLLTESEEQEARRIAARRQRERTNRLLWLGGLGALVLVGLVWGYWRYVRDPGPLPLPGSTARGMAVGPDVWSIEAGGTGALRATEAKPRLDGTVAWTSALPAAPATAAVTDGTSVYLGLEDGSVVALDAASGRTRWSVDTGDMLFAAPTIAGDRLYVPTRGGDVLALEAATGTQRWRSENTGGLLATSPVVDAGELYLFTIRGIYAFDAETGVELWMQPIDEAWATRPPVLTPEFVIVAAGGRVDVFNRRNGERTYYYRFAAVQPRSLSVQGDTLLAVYSRRLAEIDVHSKRPWWEPLRPFWIRMWIWKMAPDVPPPPEVWSAGGIPRDPLPAALDERQVYVGLGSRLMAFTRGSGAIAWDQKALPAALVDSPIATGAGILVPAADRLLLLSPSDGSVIGQRMIEGQTLRSVTVVSGATYLVGSSGVTALR